MSPAAALRLLRHAALAIKSDLALHRLRLNIARLILAPVPEQSGFRFRVVVLRLAGFQIGHGTIIMGTPHIYGDGDVYSNIRLGHRVQVNVGVTLNAGAPISVGHGAGLGQDVMLLTDTHEMGPPTGRVGPRISKPITIGDGAWLGARVVVLPGVTIGPGAVVAAGAIVTEDVPPNTLVAGVPAKVVRQLPPSP